MTETIEMNETGELILEVPAYDHRQSGLFGLEVDGYLAEKAQLLRDLGMSIEAVIHRENELEFRVMYGKTVAVSGERIPHSILDEPDPEGILREKLQNLVRGVTAESLERWIQGGQQ